MARPAPRRSRRLRCWSCRGWHRTWERSIPDCATALFGGSSSCCFCLPTSRRSRKDRPVAEEGAKRRLLRVRPDDAGAHGHRVSAGQGHPTLGWRGVALEAFAVLVGRGPRELDGEATDAPRAPAGDFRRARRAGGGQLRAAAVEHRTATQPARSHDSSRLPCEARAPPGAQADPSRPRAFEWMSPRAGHPQNQVDAATQPDAACADNGTCAESSRDEVGRCGCRSRRPGPGAGPARARRKPRGRPSMPHVTRRED